ncbi:MAG: hypothetical protein E6J20_02645 [Chloroflexi bacterium]|nr:MAG: hypothetical protein E6J20_02645 [Chloroflexota bacterium]
MKRSAGWYTDLSDPFRVRWWIHTLRWWDGETWTNFTVSRRFGWVPVVLIGAAAAWIWTIDLALSAILAQGVASTPQPNQQMWVVVSWCLPLVPVGGAVIVAVVTMIAKRRARPNALASVNAFFWLSMAVAFLAVPKAP